MPLERPALVRCAGCAHNFESRLTGRIRCPVCRSELWLEPPPGVAPDRAEDEPPPTPIAPAMVAAPAVHPADGPGEEEPAPEVRPATPEEQAELMRRLLEAGARLREAEVVVPAWEVREGRWPRRFYETCRQILTNPTSFFRGLEVDRLGRSWTFAWLLCSLGALFASMYGLWNLERNEAALLEALRAAGGLEPEEALDAWRGLLTFGAWGAPLLGLVNLFATAGLFHLGVVLVGGANRGFRATFRATAYGFVPLLLVVVPVVGQLIGSLWSVVLQVVAIAHVHRMSPGRAALAVLLPLAAALSLLLGLW